MDHTSFSFMRLPTELQAGIVNYIQANSDLKSLCLVSKHVSDIATRCLYYEIEIINSFTTDIANWRRCYEIGKEKIKSLLINPANLQFVRVIKTDRRSREESILIDQLLPHLQKDSLKEINFTSSCPGEFPTPYQIEFLWQNQKNLQNLPLITHVVPWLEKFSKEEPQPGEGQRSAILKFFTELELDDDFGEVHQCTPSNMLWPLQNLDLTVLRKLTLSSTLVDSSIFSTLNNLTFSSTFFDSSIFSTLNNLFAAGCFVNLTKLCFRHICILSQTLLLTRMPSLKWLEVTACDFQGPNLPLVLADDIRLAWLFCNDFDKVEKLIPLLAQAKGLEVLFRDCKPASLAPDGIDGDLIQAIMAHKDTLGPVWFFGDLFIMRICSNLEATLWDSVRLLKSRFNDSAVGNAH
ncbi:hypothetical protein MMC31_007947 [Peltigera leucophlebia]|nr:hypothetical protein [Peltigera leucophlebia]